VAATHGGAKAAGHGVTPGLVEADLVEEKARFLASFLLKADATEAISAPFLTKELVVEVAAGAAARVIGEKATL